MQYILSKVKLGLPYLDIIRLLRDNSPLPVAAYQVSGEYSMIKAGRVLKMIDEEKVMCLRRAGADIILTSLCKLLESYAERRDVMNLVGKLQASNIQLENVVLSRRGITKGTIVSFLMPTMKKAAGIISEWHENSSDSTT